MGQPKKLTWHTEQRKVVDLIPYLQNPRTQTEKGGQLMKHSINKFDFVEIPVINLDNTIIAGHQRIENMIQLGRTDEEIDVRVPSRKLTKEEVQEYNILSNRITEINAWDHDKLQANLTREELEFFDFSDILDMAEPEYPQNEEYKESELLAITIHFDSLDKKRRFCEIVEKHAPANLSDISQKVNAFIDKFYKDDSKL